ncbi:hypothetical protein EGW08_014347 [Elysia chlorotica]|uniref:Uncharacterized protein n=1 Tax=Elysia chlorotica TaxID=188477 RepID=A0A433T8Q3_ELYCH|nr:hypothetical protein EGW08_014347 [Elysia chlorotica]
MREELCVLNRSLCFIIIIIITIFYVTHVQLVYLCMFDQEKFPYGIIKDYLISYLLIIFIIDDCIQRVDDPSYQYIPPFDLLCHGPFRFAHTSQSLYHQPPPLAMAQLPFDHLSWSLSYVEKPVLFDLLKAAPDKLPEDVPR